MRYQGGGAKSVGLTELPMRKEDERRLRGNGAIGFALEQKKGQKPPERVRGHFSPDGRIFVSAP